MRLRSSPPPLPRLLFPPLVSSAPRIGSPLLSLPSSLSPAIPPQRRHRLRRPPLNQVSDYLLEIDFTCSARFCICTSAPVRRTSTIVRATSWTSRPMGPVLVLILRLRLSFSWSWPSASLLLTFPLTAPICGDLQTIGTGLSSRTTVESNKVRNVRIFHYPLCTIHYII